MAKKQAHRWPEKAISDPKRKGAKLMKCMNSNLSESKWADYYENTEPCDVWCEVDEKTTAVLCSKCTQMTLR